MKHRDFNYYETNAATINLRQITSSAKNACTLQRLRDGDPALSHFYLGRATWNSFIIGKGDDLGWLGYFIGKSEYLQILDIYYLPDGEEGHAFVEGIARSKSIPHIDINNLNNDGFTSTSIMGALGFLSHLEGLTIRNSNNIDTDGWSELGMLLDSGVCKLQLLSLKNNMSNGGIGASLKRLNLPNNSIGNEGLLAVVEALQSCTGLERLDLSDNDFSSAAVGLGSLSDWLQNSPVKLKYLLLDNCRISDEGLHALAEVAANQCKVLHLDENESITSTGLSYLSNAIRSDSCRVESISLQGIPIGDDGMEVLALGLADNRSVRSMYLEDLDDDISVTSAGWAALSTALCDTSSVINTYLSNHTICDICIWDVGNEERLIPPQDISQHLQLNKELPQHAARCKILMSHRHLNMEPLLHWGLRFLPLAVAWLERAKPCTSFTIHDANSDLRRRVLDESDEAFESRELTAMYEFVRGMPMEVMKSRHGLAMAAAYDKKIARIEEENKIALEQRDRKIEQLEEEIMRLRVL
eukprot:scaffold20524_cov85-Skeletonema_dohrnii-CCMP3373.AAC.2